MILKEGTKYITYSDLNLRQILRRPYLEDIGLVNPTWKLNSHFAQLASS